MTSSNRPRLGRVGITGARGVLGSRLASLLEERGVVVRTLSGDVRDSRAVDVLVQDVDLVLHCAAVVPVTSVEADLASAVAVNAGGTATVARAAALASRRLAYISTSHVYQPSHVPLDEDAAVVPSSHYGLSKLQGEQWCVSLHPDPLILRVFSFFDPRQPPTYLVPALLDRIRRAPRGATLELPGHDNVRDMADARWMAAVILDIITAGATGRYNCGTGIGRTVGSLAALVAASAGRQDLSFAGPVGSGPPDRMVADTTRLAQHTARLESFDLTEALDDLQAETGGSTTS